MTDGVNTLKTLTLSLFVFVIIVGGMAFYLTDLASDDKYGTNLDANDNITSSLDFMQDKINDTLEISENVGESIDTNTSQSNLDAIDAYTQGGIAASKYTLFSFDIAREMLEQLSIQLTFVPTWVIGALVGMLLLVFGFAMMAILLSLRKS